MFVCTVILVLAVATARADYECLCNQHVELAVYPQPNPNTNVLGQLYEFDCKATVPNAPGLVSGWAAIEYEHSLGYVTVDQQAAIQTCPGDPAVSDLITTAEPVTTTQAFETRVPPSTAVATTVEPVTTTQAFETRAPPSTAVTTTVEPTTVTSTPLPTTNTPTEATTTTTTISTTTTTQVPTTTVPPTTAQPTAVPTTTTQSTTTVTATPAATSTAQITTTQALPVTTGTHVLSGQIELCPTSWQTAASRTGSVLGQYGSSCYELVNHRYHWKHAESYCNGQGGHLFHMSSRDEEKYILSFLQQHHFNHSVWTGLHDLNSEEHFEWTSGDTLTYTNWVPGRQSNFENHNYEDCVVLVPYLYGGDWDDIPCGQTIIGTFETQEHYFICQIGGIVTGVATSSPQILQPDDISKCSHNVVQHAQQYHYALGQHGTSCYELIKHSYTWDQAENYCVRHGGHLVHIYSADEQAYVLNFLRTHSHADHTVWIGLNDEYTEEQFHWTSGAPVSYTNWLPGRQSNFANHYQEDCVVMIPQKNGLWDDIPCGSVGGFLFSASRTPHNDFICQYGVSSTQPIGGGLVGK